MNVNINFAKSYNGNSYCIWFIFPEPISYEIAIVFNKFGCVFNMLQIKEIVRLLNAANMFRQWEKVNYYTEIELCRAVENIYKENVESGIEHKEYHLALLGNTPKTAEKIIVANV